ncbi:MAG: ribosome maturation factor RimP [Betaproteobacteria bacterium AqS2]|uniref:Ribosome maturation factor RimP n=1 Tax=Candidatus Amphirhobacter heronislandensis TaxID=1732024 RepID=A0A930UG49_9GAMM|nr:ribosome maturation factor RimP [Betaproteobacteria bacterium AqS2]
MLQSTDSQQTIDSSITGLGYELLEAKRDGRGVLHVVIDAAVAGEPVGSADCDRVCKHLGYLLPAEGVDFSAIEVSTPGPERPLTKPEHFTRFRGARATIRLRAARDGRSSYTGTIAASDGDQVVLAAEEPAGEQAFSYAEIQAARLCFDPTRYASGRNR